MTKHGNIDRTPEVQIYQGGRMSGKILVIDDDGENLSSLTALLEINNYTVLTARDGDIALKILREKRPDLVIMNMLLPGIDGFELCEIMKADPTLKDIPVIMLTPMCTDTDDDFQIDLPDHLTKADVLLPKPPKDESLLEHVRVLLGGRPEKGELTVEEKESILIIDDDPQNRLILKTRLKAEGFEVVEASDGLEGLAKLEGDPPSLVMLDIQMPGMDGIQVLEQIRRSHPEVAVIMITAYGSQEIAVEAMKMGANDYICKPIDCKRLIPMITNLVQNHRLKLAKDRLTRQLKQVSLELIKGVEKLRQTNRMLVETRDRLVKAERLAAITETAVAINHEINNPLFVILGNAELLLGRLKGKDERAVEKLQKIKENCLRISQATYKLSKLIEPVTIDYLEGKKMIDIGASRDKGGSD
ncbi:MAG TPA: response regulator, partial [Candidatus Latescibacteria bacterium]|nr:response regulator [Candidatus Latescibacterota bacterium]